MSEIETKLSASEVLPFIDRMVDGVQGLPADESHWTNGEVLELLGIIRDGLRHPEWSQVQIEMLLGERDSLRRALEADRAAMELAGALWESAVEQLTGERDRARALAARLEGELARVPLPYRAAVQR